MLALTFSLRFSHLERFLCSRASIVSCALHGFEGQGNLQAELVSEGPNLLHRLYEKLSIFGVRLLACISILLPLESLDLSKQRTWLFLGLLDLWNSAQLRQALMIDHLSCSSFLLSFFIFATKTLSQPVSNFFPLLFDLWVRPSQVLQRLLVLLVQDVGLKFV